MDTNTLLPFLSQKHLLTTEDWEVLSNPYKARAERNKHLLSILPTKGEKAFELFVKCLEEENEHLSHHELAALLKRIDSVITGEDV